MTLAPKYPDESNRGESGKETNLSGKVEAHQMEYPIGVDARGVAYLNGSRIKVSQIAEETNQGCSPQEIQDAHTHLSMAQIHAALFYYYSHKADIDSYIERSHAEAQALLSEIATPIDRQGLEERWRQRQASKNPT